MSRWWWSTWLALALSLSACGYDPTEQEKQTVDEMTTSMRAWGFGRHLMDLPATWGYAGGDVTLYYGLGSDFETVEVRVIAENVSPEKFRSVIDARAKRIGAVSNDETRGSMLVLNQRLSSGSVLLRYFDATITTNYHKHEVHLLVDDVYVMLLADSFEGVIGPVESRLQQLATQIYKVIDPERAGAGFVLGPIIIRGEHDHENGTMYFYDEQRTDMELEAGVSAVTPDEEVKLSQRDLSGFGLPRSAYLREGNITLAGMVGEEMLLGYQDASGSAPFRQLLFIAESYRSTPGFLHPTIDLRLTGGGERGELIDPESRDLSLVWLPNFATPHEAPGTQAPSVPLDPSLTDYEAMEVWDAILKSVRPRSGAVAPPPQQTSSVYIDPQKVEADRRALDDFLASGPRSIPRE